MLANDSGELHHTSNRVVDKMNNQDKQIIRDIIHGAMHRLGKVSMRQAKAYIIVNRMGESDDVYDATNRLLEINRIDKFQVECGVILGEL